MGFEAHYIQGEGIVASNVDFCYPVPSDRRDLLLGPWTYEALGTPRFFIKERPYLAFLPKNPFSLMYGPIFGRLNYTFNTLPVRQVDNDGAVSYMLDDSVLIPWSRLEVALFDMCQRLQSGLKQARYAYINHLPMPNDYGYREPHSSLQFVRRAAIRARDAFFTMAAMASFLIVLWRRPGELQSLPDWARHLHGAHYNLLWIADLQNSFVCNPNSSNCVGAFFSPYDRYEENWVETFRVVGVPFWIVWGEIGFTGRPNAVVPNIPIFQNLFPPVNERQKARQRPPRFVTTISLGDSDAAYRTDYGYSEEGNVSSFSGPSSSYDDIGSDNFPTESVKPIVLSTLPPVEETPSLSDTVVAAPQKPMPNPSRESRQKPGETWVDFFERRRVENLKRLEKETLKDRQLREAREKHAKTLGDDDPFPKGSLVFEWTLDDGHYMRHVRANKKAMQGLYDCDQRSFDGFRNEWDLHERFSKRSVVEQYQDLLVLKDHPSSINEITTQDAAAAHPILPPPSSSSLDLSRTGQSLETFLFQRYGFTAVYDTEYVAIGYHTTNNRTASTLVGALSFLGSCDIPQLAAKTNSLLDFVNVPSSEDIRDLGTVDFYNVGFSQFVRQHHFSIALYAAPRNEAKTDKPKETLKPSYVFSDRETSWQLAIKDPVTALEIIRADWLDWGIKGIANALLARGSPFSTLKLKPQDGSPRLWEYTQRLGDRFLNHNFDAVEYAAYVESRERLLSGRFGRIALARGGIAWRLALEVVNKDEVLRGPYSSGNNDCEVRGVYKKRPYYDDGADVNAWEVLCGVYSMPTPDCKNLERVTYQSWWPLPAAWDKGWRNQGYWTEGAEIWYQKRLEDIHAGSAELYNNTQWKSNLKGPTGAVTFRTAYAEAAARLLPTP